MQYVYAVLLLIIQQWHKI